MQLEPRTSIRPAHADSAINLRCRLLVLSFRYSTEEHRVVQLPISTRDVIVGTEMEPTTSRPPIHSVIWPSHIRKKKKKKRILPPLLPWSRAAELMITGPGLVFATSYVAVGDIIPLQPQGKGQRQWSPGLIINGKDTICSVGPAELPVRMPPGLVG